jgi:hypothetical protein
MNTFQEDNQKTFQELEELKQTKIKTQYLCIQKENRVCTCFTHRNPLNLKNRAPDSRTLFFEFSLTCFSYERQY